MLETHVCAESVSGSAESVADAAVVAGRDDVLGLNVIGYICGFGNEATF